ncbi:MAG: hypothetical protein IH595_11590 [Bacteroidales bacterium]|nr:hypothetical protein [Bacteroidales bacterium]
MKKFSLGFLLIFLFATAQMSAQVSATTVKQKINVGVDVFTDVWMNVPSGMTVRTLNPSANVFATYNILVGAKKTGNTVFSIGLGIGSHVLSSKTNFIKDVKADTISFIPVPSGISMKKSKMTITSLEVPAVLNFKLKHGWHAGIGFKISMVINSKEAYTGTLSSDRITRQVKNKGIYQLNSTGYTPSIRFGYKSFDVFAAYQLISTFRTGHGPALHPISIGISITPF